MIRSILSYILPLLSAASIVNAAAAGETTSSPPFEVQLSGHSLVSALRTGGYVIYFRHTATDRSQTDQDRADFANCSTQRNLSTEGRQQAAAIGLAFKSLAIRVNKVVTSPYCRARDTGQLAFGQVVTDEILSYSIGADSADTERRASALRRMLSEQPAAGRNTVIVAHTSNLKEATGIWPNEEGTAVIFRPKGDSHFEPVALVKMDEWATILASR
jgi:phosphohistidine phosphatase SixA